MWTISDRVGAGCAVLAVAVLAGCSQPAEEPIAKHSSALSVEVTAAFDVERYPETFSTSQLQDVQFACGSERCLGAHRVRLADGRSFLLATRVDTTGQVLDFPRIVLREGGSTVRVIAGRDEFLVITADSSTGPLAYYLVRGSDGRVTPVTSNTLPQAGPVRGASTGDSWLLLSPAESTSVRAQVYDTGFVARGSGTTLDSAVASTIADPIPGPGQYVFAAYGRVVRLDEASGNPLDAAPIVLSSLMMPGRMPGVFIDGIYQFAFGAQTLYQSRLDAETGEVLDPDDTFNQIPGPKQFASLTTRGTGDVDVDLVGGKVVVTEALVNDRVSAVSLDPKTGKATGSNEFYSILQTSIIGDPTHELHPLQGSMFLLDSETLLQLGTSSQPLSAGFSAEKLALGVAGLDRFRCKTASNGAGFLVVFARGSAMYQQGSEILATRVDPSTGAYLDDPPLLVGTGEYPAVASDGQNYLVSWLSTADGRTHAHYRLVRADGSMNQGDSAVIFDTVQGFEPGMAYNGAYYGVTWGSRAARIDTNGKFVPPDQAPAGSTFYMTGLIPRLGEPGPRVAVDTTPPPERRTFLLVGETSVGVSDSRDIGIRALRSATGALVGGGTIAEKHRSPFAVSDGTRVLVVSQEEATGSWYGVFVDPVNVALIPNTRQLMVENPAQHNPPPKVDALFFDGNSYHLVVTERVDSTDIAAKTYLRRFDAALARVAEESASGVLLSGQLSAYWYADAINLRADRGLFVFQAVDLARLGTAIKGVFFAADGSPLPPIGMGGAGAGGSGPSSTGGSAGSGGAPTAGAGGGNSNGGAGSALGAEAGAASTEMGGANDGGGGASASANGGDAGKGGAGPSQPGSGSSEAGAADPGDAGASTKSSSPPSDGCGCRVVSPSPSRLSPWVSLGVLGLLARRRRSRGLSRRTTSRLAAKFRSPASRAS